MDFSIFFRCDGELHIGPIADYFYPRNDLWFRNHFFPLYDPTTTRHFWRCSRRFEAPLPPQSLTLEQAVRYYEHWGLFCHGLLSADIRPLEGETIHPGSTSVTISLWRRICFCRSLNHRNDWDPTPCSSSQLCLPSSYKSYCGWSPTPRQSPACYTLFLLQRYNRHLNSNV